MCFFSGEFVELFLLVFVVTRKTDASFCQIKIDATSLSYSQNSVFSFWKKNIAIYGQPLVAKQASSYLCGHNNKDSERALNLGALVGGIQRTRTQMTTAVGLFIS